MAAPLTDMAGGMLKSKKVIEEVKAAPGPGVTAGQLGKIRRVTLALSAPEDSQQAGMMNPMGGVSLYRCPQILSAANRSEISRGRAGLLLRANGTDADQWYTRTFSGTSSASPIVAGAVALIQSTRSASGVPKLDPIAMRSLLVSTGTPQATGTTPNIGPMPNLRAAIATYR